MSHESTALRVVNAVSRGVFSVEWKERLELLLQQIARGPHRLAKNYLPENMDLKRHLSFDLLINANDEIVSFAGVYNGGRYPGGVYRVLNRTWVADSLRVHHGAFPYLTSRLILPVQIRQHAEELKLIFVSREKPSGKFFLEKWKAHQPEPSQWSLSDKMVQVVPQVYKQSCFQYICYRNLSEVKWTPPSVDEAGWSAIS